MPASPLNQPRLAAMALARTIRHVFPDRPSATWQAALPLLDAEEIEKHPPRTFRELAARLQSPAVAALLRHREGLKQLRKQLRKCWRLASQSRRCGTAGREYAAVFASLLRGECTRNVSLAYESFFEDEGEYYIHCEVRVMSPIAAAADQMAKLASKIRPPAKATKLKRAGRPRTVTPELTAEARALFEQLRSWAKATEELNRRYPGNGWKTNTVAGWKRYSRHRDRAAKNPDRAA